MRVTALDALASTTPDPVHRARLYARATGDGDPYVAGQAWLRRTAIERLGEPAP